MEMVVKEKEFIDGVGGWLFALFLFAGYFKADPRLKFIQERVDLTLFFFALSLVVSSYRALRYGCKVPKSFLRAFFLFSILAVYFMVGLLWTQSQGYGFDKVWRFIVLTGWAFVESIFVSSGFSSFKRFFWALTTVAAVMAIDALMRWRGFGRIAFVTAFGSNYIALARAGGLGFLTATGLLLPLGQKRTVRFILWIAAFLCLWAALSAGARGPVLALFVSSLLFLVTGLRGLRLLMDRFTLRLGVVLILIGVLVWVFGQILFPTLFFRFRVFTTEIGRSALERFNLYRIAIDLWADSPIWGHGPGQFGAKVTGEDIRLYPHNILLELGAEVGVIGVIVFTSFVGYTFGKGFQLLFHSKGLIRIVVRYLLAACSFLLLNAMVSGDINDNRLLFTFIGLTSALSYPRLRVFFEETRKLCSSERGV